MSYIGEVIASIILPPISDRYGRKYFTYIGAIVQLAIYLLFLTSTSIMTYLSIILMFGATISIRHFITYPHLMEVFPASKAAFVSGLLFFIDGLVYIVSPILLLMTNDTRILIYIAIVMNLCSLITIVIYIKPGESVKYLVSKGLYDLAIKEAHRIC